MPGAAHPLTTDLPPTPPPPPSLALRALRDELAMEERQDWEEFNTPRSQMMRPPTCPGAPKAALPFLRLGPPALAVLLPFPGGAAESFMVPPLQPLPPLPVPESLAPPPLPPAHGPAHQPAPGPAPDQPTTGGAAGGACRTSNDGGTAIDSRMDLDDD